MPTFGVGDAVEHTEGVVGGDRVLHAEGMGAHVTGKGHGHVQASRAIISVTARE